MMILTDRRVLNVSYTLVIVSSILLSLSACSTGTPTPSLLGTPVPTTVATIAAENVDQLTEVAHWTLGSSANVKYCMAFSPDGKLLAMAYHEPGNPADTPVVLMDVAAGNLSPLSPLKGLSGGVNCMVFSPDGQTVAASSWDKMVKIWNVASGQVLHTFTFPDAAYGVAFSPDGKIIAVGVRDGTAQLVAVDSGQVLHTLVGHTALVHSVNFSPDGTRLATGSFDGTIKLWNVNSGEEIQTLSGHSQAVWKVVFSPDGVRLASASGDGTVGLWDSATGQRLFTLRDEHVIEWYDVSFSVDGKLVTAASNQELVLWDVSSGLELRYTHVPNQELDYLESIGTSAFSPDGRLLATGGYGTVRLWGVP